MDMNVARSRLGKRLWLGLMGAMLLGAGSVWAQGNTPRLVVFGDSLSDPGNAFALLGATNTPPDYSVDAFLVPERPYARGGHHFTNGPTWVEQLARARGMAANANPAFQSSNPGATNYAVGSARARDDGSQVNLPHQVQLFLQDSGGAAPAGALYVIEVIGNDIRDVASTGNTALLGQGLTAIAASVLTLYSAGATHFLIWNAPKVALTPAIQKAGAPAAALVDQLTVAYNQQFNAVVANLRNLPGIRIDSFDAYHEIDTIHANPADFGLTDVADPCIQPGVQPFFCQNPDEYLFWDGIHPTKAVHAIFAGAVANLLAQ